MNLAREAVKTKHNDVKLIGRNNNRAKEPEGVRLQERLVCDSIKMALAFFKTLEAQVEDADAKYAKIDKKTARLKEDLRVRIPLLQLSLKAGKSPTAHFGKDCVDKNPTRSRCAGGSVWGIYCHKVAAKRARRDFAPGTCRAYCRKQQIKMCSPK